MIYYLKINRRIDYTYRNIIHWIDIVSYDKEGICYVICDNSDLEEDVKRRLDDKKIDIQIMYMKSLRGERERELIKNMANRTWENAGLAHLTSFLHANDNKYSYFWNIDADDTVMCLDPPRAFEALKQVENYAIQNKIDVFSLDMWRSQSKGRSWSFGITIINGIVDWESAIKRNINSSGNITKWFVNRISPKNIDEFFMFIKNVDMSLNIGTFYLRNLWFIHYSDDFIYNPIQSGIYMWEDGYLVLPIIRSVFGADSMGKLPIPADVVEIDAGIHKAEGQYFLARYANYTFECGNIINAIEYDERNKRVIEDTLEARISVMIENLGRGSGLYIWGCCDLTEYIIESLKKQHIEVKGIVDNNSRKWGEEVCGVKVFAPDTVIKNINESETIVVDNKYYRDIWHQLERLGYKKTPYWLTDYRDMIYSAVNTTDI